MRGGGVAARPLQAGDRLILSSPLGQGVYAQAANRGLLLPHDLAQFETSRHQAFDAPDRLLACLQGVRRIAKLGDSGFLVALCRMLESAGLGARLHIDHIPRFPEAERLLREHPAPVAAAVNWAQVAGEIRLGEPCPQELRALLSAPEPGGNLLICCAPEDVTEVLAILLQHDCLQAAPVGEVLDYSAPARVILQPT